MTKAGVLAALALGLLGAAMMPVAAGASSAPKVVPLGPALATSLPVYSAYYDGHKDTFVVTDVSNRAQATAMHVNYSAALHAVRGAPFQYFVEGPAAPGQVSVLGSEPGEVDYNPLWEEIVVKWNPGVSPVLLVRDDQINALAKQHKLTKTDLHVVMNAPELTVGS
jgi:hypothetical protein